jgi:hypothetical protein
VGRGNDAFAMADVGRGNDAGTDVDTGRGIGAAFVEPDGNVFAFPSSARRLDWIVILILIELRWVQEAVWSSIPSVRYPPSLWHPQISTMNRSVHSERKAVSNDPPKLNRAGMSPTSSMIVSKHLQSVVTLLFEHSRREQSSRNAKRMQKSWTQVRRSSIDHEIDEVTE